MLKVYYLHGFASYFEPQKPKIKTLSKLGPVTGHNIDYTWPANKVVSTTRDLISKSEPDVIVGTSMGGWLAATVGAQLRIPFTAINPAIDPSKSLLKHVGEGVDFQDCNYYLDEATVNTYFPIETRGCGLILLDADDEVMNSQATKDALDSHFQVEMFPGGNHRFSHLEESLPLITNLCDMADINYGLHDDD